MSKITIPKKAMDLALNVNPDRWYETKNEFLRILRKEYPNLSLDEAEQKFYKIQDRKRFTSSNLEYIEKYKKDMMDYYYRYEKYKMYNDLDNLKTIESAYLFTVKKCHDDIVDELHELGINRPYAPTDMSQIPKFVNSLAKQQSDDTGWAVLIAVTTMMILLMAYVTYCFNN